MKHCIMPCLGLLFASSVVAAEPAAKGPADLIVHHAKVVTVDDKFRTFEAIAVKDGRILALGDDDAILKLGGPKTRVLDADGHTVLPGLSDSHMHPASTAIIGDQVGARPQFESLKEALAALRQMDATRPAGAWLFLYSFPTRVAEERFPTRAELDEAAPKHPALFQAEREGCVVNSMALKVSGITKDTPDPPGGMIVKDPKTGEPTGMLRNAFDLLKGVPKGSGPPAPPEVQQAAAKKLFALYNAQGLISIGDRNADRGMLDVYLGLRDRGELTVRVNATRAFDPSGTREEIGRQLEELPGKDKRGGPTGVGDEWVRVGALKLYVDGGPHNGTAYMREPWPKGEMFQITEDNYRGLLFLKPDQLQLVIGEAAKRGWQVAGHAGGEAGMDVLLDAYDKVDQQTSIKERRFCIAHSFFPSQENLERCKRLGVCADVQPSWLFKDGAALTHVLGDQRMRWYQPYKTWLEYTTVGGGSDHIVGFDPLGAINPYNPWLGMWVALTRATEHGGALHAEERLSREQALRLYTINNAYLNHEEKDKGSLEVGKLADLIVIDRDILTCPVDAVRDTKVLCTVVGGKVVYERKGE